MWLSYLYRELMNMPRAAHKPGGDLVYACMILLSAAPALAVAVYGVHIIVSVVAGGRDFGFGFLVFTIPLAAFSLFATAICLWRFLKCINSARRKLSVTRQITSQKVTGDFLRDLNDDSYLREFCASNYPQHLTVSLGDSGR